MAKKPYLLAVGLLLLIPLVAMLGSGLSFAINPEIAAHYANYERNFRLLSLVKSLILLATLLVIMGLWFSSGFLILKAKGRSYRWLPLAVLGPLGFIPLRMLGDSTPSDEDAHRRFVRGLNIFLRVGYELAVIVGLYLLAFEIVELHHYLIVLFQAMTTGASVAQIIQIQNASSGMWAFGEEIENLFLFVLLYLLWPMCFNMIARVLRLGAQRQHSSK